jgi:tetratricopeptide (TPR) repeat protein
MIMKKIVLFILALGFTLAAGAQNAKSYSEKYDKMLGILGPAGVGMETILNGWEKADSTDAKMLKARYLYHFTKSRSTEVVTKETATYLGKEPLMTLKDTLGKDVRYFESPVYDDQVFGKAMQYLDKAITYYPENLDFRFLKAASLMDYEKESPDMTLSLLIELAQQNNENKYKWQFTDVENPDKEFVEAAIQEYCYTFYKINSPSSLEAFNKLSLKMLEFNPKNTTFLSNIGSYYQAKSDYKNAIKFYSKVLKLDPANYPAIKNSCIIANKTQDKKLLKKYLPMLVKYGSEADKLSAQARLDGLNKK